MIQNNIEQDSHNHCSVTADITVSLRISSCTIHLALLQQWFVSVDSLSTVTFPSDTEMSCTHGSRKSMTFLGMSCGYCLP